MMGQFVEIAPRVSVLTELVPIDGHVSWLPPDAAGYEPYNVYLVESDEAVVLVDTGVALHRRSILDNLAAKAAGRRILVFNTRSELECIGNIGAILDTFDDVQLVTACPLNPHDLVHRRQPQRRHAPAEFLAFGDTLEELGFPRLKTVRPVIKMLGTGWLYDSEGKVLFSSDCFGADLMSSPAEPVVRTSAEGAPPARQLRDTMLAKFDWLEHAERPPLRQAWDATLGPLEIAVLAPNHGRVQGGPRLGAEVLAEYREVLLG